MVEYDLESDYSLTFVAATRDMDFFVQFDDDNTTRNRANSLFNDKASRKSFEARVNSPDFDRWNFVAGVLYFDQSVDSDQKTGPLPPGAGPIEPFKLILGEGGVDTTSIGAYFHAIAKLSDNLDLNVGLRWTDDEKTGEWTQDTNDVISGLGFIPPDVVVPSVTESWSEVTPTVSLTYNAGENTIVYGKYAQGFKSGSMLPDIINIETPDEFILQPETVDSYEIGLKTTMMDNRIRINTAIFSMDYKNLQIINLSPRQGGGFVGSNAGSAKLNGLEVELDWAATENLEISLTAGLLDAEYQGLIRGGDDLSGNVPRNAPETTASLQGSYSLPLSNGGSFNALANVSYRDDVFYDPENTAAIAQEAYSLITARLGYGSPDDVWAVYLWGRNLSDEKYAAFGRAGPFGQSQKSYGTPRTVGLELSYNV